MTAGLREYQDPTGGAEKLKDLWPALPQLEPWLDREKVEAAETIDPHLGSATLPHQLPALVLHTSPVFKL